jgi:putative ABC transport system substrate-binding protein
LVAGSGSIGLRATGRHQEDIPVITRRDVLMMLSLLGAGLGARAQVPKSGRPRRIGILQLVDPSRTLEDDRDFWIAMTRIGWILDDNIVVERAYADGNEVRLASLAEELVRKRVEVILTLGQAAPVAAARATRTIPIVFFGVLWPVEQGLIDSFARPGRNVTGIAAYTGIEVTNKRLEFLREIVPAAKRLSWVWQAGFFRRKLFLVATSTWFRR